MHLWNAKNIVFLQARQLPNLFGDTSHWKAPWLNNNVRHNFCKCTTNFGNSFTYLWRYFLCAIPGPYFHYFRLFNTGDSKRRFNVNFADDWIQTADLWSWKRPLYQTTAQRCREILNFTNKLWKIWPQKTVEKTNKILFETFWRKNRNIFEKLLPDFVDDIIIVVVIATGRLFSEIRNPSSTLASICWSASPIHPCASRLRMRPKETT